VPCAFKEGLYGNFICGIPVRDNCVRFAVFSSSIEKRERVRRVTVRGEMDTDIVTWDTLMLKAVRRMRLMFRKEFFPR
jgi:hypothetical protein